MPSGMGYGAAVGLEKVLERMFLEQQAKIRAAENQRQMDIQMRGQDVSMRGQDLDYDVSQGQLGLGHDRLGLDRDKFGQDVTQWGDMAPQRAANVRLAGAQATDIEGRPGAREDEQAFEAGENALNRTNALRVAGVRAQSGSAGAAGDMKGVAEMVIGNPELLQQLNPTARTAVLREIAGSGETLRPQKQKLLDNILNETEAALAELQGHPGMRGGVGAPSLTSPGSWTRLAGMPAVPGSQEAGFAKSLDKVKSLLTVPRLDLMRGLGPMSEREFAAMQASASKLDPALGEAEFIAELQRLLQATQTARRANTAPPAQVAAPAAAPAGEDILKKYGL